MRDSADYGLQTHNYSKINDTTLNEDDTLLNGDLGSSGNTHLQTDYFFSSQNHRKTTFVARKS